jgi:nucleotide-binding universal stress UspA family protein
MFKKILVPLDGSVEAETVLPYVRDLASRFNSEVDVLSVGVGSKRRRVNQLLDTYIHHAVEHLEEDSITCRSVFIYGESTGEIVNYTGVTLDEGGLKAKGAIVYGGPADQILAYTGSRHVDLIIMATHGVGGLRRWWLGSVSEKIVTHSATPILLIHSKHVRQLDQERKTSFKHILAPLDGSDTGEAALHHAAEIALKAGASITLLHVIPEVHAIESRILGKEFNGIVKAMHNAGKKYLEKVASRLQARGITSVIRIANGDPAETIVDTAVHEKVDLIAMSTHGRSGIARWVLGSVADKLIHESKLPMWLVRPQRIINKIQHNQSGKAD